MFRELWGVFSLKMVAPLATKIVMPDFESFELKNSEVLEPMVGLPEHFRYPVSLMDYFIL